jgi:hypothetical protein
LRGESERLYAAGVHLLAAKPQMPAGESERLYAAGVHLLAT